MLIGVWKNVEELEECLCLAELKLILDSRRDEQMRIMKFQAQLKGIDLDKADTEEAQRKFREVQDRVNAKLAGMSSQQYEYDQMGFAYEEEEELPNPNMKIVGFDLEEESEEE